MAETNHETPVVLTVNAGSSSVKWALFLAAASPARTAGGRIERIGLPDGIVTFTDGATGHDQRRVAQIHDHAAAVRWLIDQLAQSGRGISIKAIGHRVVHGGSRYVDPQVISGEVMEELRRLSPYDPEHLPAELTLIEAFAAQYPTIPQVACFDTGFHQHLPAVARLIAIPRRYEKQGVRRYGFHGLSYAYLMDELERVAGREAAHGKVILAHLGNGASLAAVRDGVSIDTTMGFTPASGLPMSTWTAAAWSWICATRRWSCPVAPSANVTMPSGSPMRSIRPPADRTGEAATWNSAHLTLDDPAFTISTAGDS